MSLIFSSVSVYNPQGLIFVLFNFHAYLSLKCDVVDVDDTYEENGNYIEYPLFDKPWDKCCMYINYFNFLEITYFLSALQDSLFYIPTIMMIFREHI